MSSSAGASAAPNTPMCVCSKLQQARCNYCTDGDVRFCGGCSEQTGYEEHQKCQACDTPFCPSCFEKQQIMYYNGNQPRPKGVYLTGLSRCFYCDPPYVERRTLVAFQYGLNGMLTYARDQHREQLQPQQKNTVLPASIFDTLAKQVQSVQQTMHTIEEHKHKQTPWIRYQPNPSVFLQHHCGKRKATTIIDSVLCGACEKRMDVRPTYAICRQPEALPMATSDNDKTDDKQQQPTQPILVYCQQCDRPYCFSCAQRDPGYESDNATMFACMQCPVGKRSNVLAAEKQRQAEEQAFEKKRQELFQQLRQALAASALDQPTQNLAYFIESLYDDEPTHGAQGLQYLLYDLKHCIANVVETKENFEWTYTPYIEKEHPFAKLYSTSIRESCTEVVKRKKLVKPTYRLHVSKQVKTTKQMEEQCSVV